MWTAFFCRQWALFREDILKCHRRKSTSAHTKHKRQQLNLTIHFIVDSSFHDVSDCPIKCMSDQQFLFETTISGLLWYWRTLQKVMILSHVSLKQRLCGFLLVLNIGDNDPQGSVSLKLEICAPCFRVMTPRTSCLSTLFASMGCMSQPLQQPPGADHVLLGWTSLISEDQHTPVPLFDNLWSTPIVSTLVQWVCKRQLNLT